MTSIRVSNAKSHLSNESWSQPGATLRRARKHIHHLPLLPSGILPGLPVKPKLKSDKGDVVVSAGQPLGSEGRMERSGELS